MILDENSTYSCLSLHNNGESSLNGNENEVSFGVFGGVILPLIIYFISAKSAQVHQLFCTWLLGHLSSFEELCERFLFLLQ